MSRPTPAAVPLHIALAVGLLAASVSAQPAPDLVEADRWAAAADSLVEAEAYGQAEDAARQALRLTEAAVGPDDARLADRLSALAWLLEGGGAVQDAEPLYARALAIAEAAPGQPDLGVHLINLGLARQALGEHTSANPLFARAAEVFEGAGDPIGAAESRFNLGLGLFYLGAYAEAVAPYQAALDTFEEVLGPDHPNLAFPLTGLARVDHAAGDYAAARARYEQAIALREAALGPDHPAVANDRNELGWLLVDIGDYAEAARVSEAVVAATDSVRGAEAVASRALYTLGVAQARMRQTDAADAAFDRALAIREAALGPDHPAVAQLLAERAALADRAGDLDRARDLYGRALAIRTAALGDGHPNVAATLDPLAWVDARLGNDAQAVAQARRALDVWAAALPPSHPSVAASQAGLAEVLAATDAGDAAEIRRLLLASTAALTDHAQTVLPALAWAEQRAFLDATLRRQTATVLTALGDTPAFDAAYADLAGWKGLLLHGLRRQAALDRLADDPAHAEAVAALAAVRADLAGWFQRAGTMPLAAWQARNDSLNARKEALERALAAALPPGALADPLADLDGGTAAFRARLPEATAFVDVYRYGLRTAADSVVASYAAAVSSPGGLAFVPLGPAAELDAAIDAWRTTVVREGDGEVEWAEIGARVWTPLAEALPGDLAGVWVSPDGLLGRIPWGLLPGDGGLPVSVVDSARELVYLLDRGAARGEPGLVLAVGDIDFGEGYRFDPLPATAGEVAALEVLAAAEGARFEALTGAEATARAVRERLSMATHVHLATHGVFVDDALPGGDGAWARSPLVESGLAFAGANEGPGGMLTAETLVGVDHTGTDLVVLSACETGLGTEVAGQGVMGLRAAFTTAGARSVLMSLWQVPDESTAALMGHFYRALWTDKLPVADALRAAQAAVRADPATAAPRHWAGWMVVGAGW